MSEESKKSGWVKFESGATGIVNSRGDEVSMDYLRRYVHCWCRVSDGYVSAKRHEIIESYLTPEFLAAHKSLTASQIGKLASQDPRWGKPAAAPAAPAVPEKVAAEINAEKSGD